jgi:hypothetical protein
MQYFLVFYLQLTVTSVLLEAGNILAGQIQAYNLDKHISRAKPVQNILMQQ